MRKILLAVCLSFFCVGSPRGLAAPEKIRFLNDDSLGDAEKTQASEASKQIRRLLSKWTWKDDIDGRWEIYLVHAKSLHQLESGTPSAVAPGEFGNRPSLILAWDLLLKTSNAPGTGSRMGRKFRLGLSGITA